MGDSARTQSLTGNETHITTTATEFDLQRRADAEAMALATVCIESATGVYLPARGDAYARLRCLTE